MLHNSVTSRILTLLYNYHHHQFLKLFHHFISVSFDMQNPLILMKSNLFFLLLPVLSVLYPRSLQKSMSWSFSSKFSKRFAVLTRISFSMHFYFALVYMWRWDSLLLHVSASFPALLVEMPVPVCESLYLVFVLLVCMSVSKPIPHCFHYYTYNL